MAKRVHVHPNLIYAVGAQVVTLADVTGLGRRTLHPRGAVVRGYELSRHVRVHWLPDGDHSFKPRSSSGRTQVENWREGISVIADFVKRRVG